MNEKDTIVLMLGITDDLFEFVEEYLVVPKRTKKEIRHEMRAQTVKRLYDAWMEVGRATDS